MNFHYSNNTIILFSFVIISYKYFKIIIQINLIIWTINQIICQNTSIHLITITYIFEALI